MHGRRYASQVQEAEAKDKIVALFREWITGETLVVFAPTSSCTETIRLNFGEPSLSLPSAPSRRRVVLGDGRRGWGAPSLHVVGSSDILLSTPVVLHWNRGMNASTEVTDDRDICRILRGQRLLSVRLSDDGSSFRFDCGELFVDCRGTPAVDVFYDAAEGFDWMIYNARSDVCVTRAGNLLGASEGRVRAGPILASRVFETLNSISLGDGEPSGAVTTSPQAGQNKPVDWRGLAERLGAIEYKEKGSSESGGTSVARAAVSEMLGDKLIESAVRYYVSGGPGSETARSVLMLLRPRLACEVCMEIYRTGRRRQDKCYAIELLRDVATVDALPDIEEVLEHDDPSFTSWGADAVAKLFFDRGELEDEVASKWAQRLVQHSNPQVVETGREIALAVEGRAREEPPEGGR